MKKNLLIPLILMASSSFTFANPQQWLQISEAPKFKAFVDKTDLSKGSFDRPFLLHMKSVAQYGETNRAGDTTAYSTYYIDCKLMREALADTVSEDVDSSGVSKKSERKIYFDSRQLPPDSAWKSMGIGVHSPNNFCRHVPGWDVKKLKTAYPNKNWRSVQKDNPIFFLNESDLSFSLKNKPFPVRAKQFTTMELEQGEVTAITFTELIDCKNEKSRPISKLFTAGDTILNESTNPVVIKTEAVNGDWRPFNEKNNVFSEICKQ